MTTPTTPAELTPTGAEREDGAEALAAEICGCDRTAHDPGRREECAYALRSAELALASDWLRDALAAARQDERERIAAAIETTCSHFGRYTGVPADACGYCEDAARIARAAGVSRSDTEGGEQA